MGKEEFLQGMHSALLGEVPQNIIQENIQYYGRYISDEVQLGKTEEQVIYDIGNPRLIAKTIIDAQASMEGADTQKSYGYDSSAFTGGNYGSGDQDTLHKNQNYGDKGFRLYNLNTWYGKLLGIVILIAIISLIVTIIGGLFSLIAPLIVPLCLVVIVMRIFRGTRK